MLLNINYEYYDTIHSLHLKNEDYIKKKQVLSKTINL